MHSRALGEEAQLSSGWILIRSELFSLNFNSSVRTEQSFAIRYPNIVITSVCGNLDICLNYKANTNFRLWNSVLVTTRKEAFLDRDFQSRS